MWLSILDKRLWLVKHGRIFSQTSSLIITKLLLLLYVAKGSSSLNLREKRMILESNFSLARVNLTHTLGTFRDHSEATVCLSFRLMDQIHHKRLQNHTHLQCAGRTSVERLHDRTPIALQHVFPHVEASNRKNQIWVVGVMSTPQADWLLGLPLTIFRSMWLVLSHA
jgi:hypothetical protein